LLIVDCLFQRGRYKRNARKEIHQMAAIQSRAQLISRLAEVDTEIEDLFLNEVEPSSAKI